MAKTKSSRDGKPAAKAAKKSKKARPEVEDTAARGLIPAPYPVITSPAPGATFNGGASVPVTAGTNITTRAHSIRVLDATGTPVPGLAATPIDFSTSNPQTVNVTLPPAASDDYDCFIEISAPGTPAGTPHRVPVRVRGFKVTITPNPLPDDAGMYPTDTDIDFTASVTGGSGSYAFVWTLVTPVAADVRTYTTNPCSSTASYEGDYRMWVNVIDTADPAKSATGLMLFSAFAT